MKAWRSIPLICLLAFWFGGSPSTVAGGAPGMPWIERALDTPFEMLRPSARDFFARYGRGRAGKEIHGETEFYYRVTGERFVLVVTVQTVNKVDTPVVEISAKRSSAVSRSYPSLNVRLPFVRRLFDPKLQGEELSRLGPPFRTTREEGRVIEAYRGALESTGRVLEIVKDGNGQVVAFIASNR